MNYSSESITSETTLYPNSETTLSPINYRALNVELPYANTSFYNSPVRFIPSHTIKISPINLDFESPNIINAVEDTNEFLNYGNAFITDYYDFEQIMSSKMGI